MATIIVEDGSVVAGANSYVSEAELTAYATDRGLALTSTADVLIIQSMDYLQSLEYIGFKHTENQPLQWPRDNVIIDGYHVEPTTIPVDLKSGQMAAAIAIDEGNSPLATIGRATRKEKLDVMEVEYMDGSVITPIARTINAALKKLLVGGSGGGSQFKVSRG